MAQIRAATVADIDVLVRHRRKMLEEVFHATAAELDALDREYRRWARTRIRSGRLVAFVVEERGRVRGSGAVWLMPVPPRPSNRGNRAPYLMSMYTEREDRGKGYATMVVDAAVAWSKAHGHKVVILHASDEGKRIYEKAGFFPTPEMRLRLDRPRRKDAVREPASGPTRRARR